MNECPEFELLRVRALLRVALECRGKPLGESAGIESSRELWIK